MVNKKFCLGILVMVLVFGMTVVGCSDDAQIVAFEYAEGTSNVTVGLIYSGDKVSGVSVYWNNVKNALSYDVYGQIEPIDYFDIKLIPDIKHFSTIQADGIGLNGVVYGAQIDVSELIKGGKWRFGVTVTDIDKNHVPSKIVWSEYVSIPFAENMGTPHTP